MGSHETYTISYLTNARSAMRKLNDLAQSSTLFITDDGGKLVGSLTDSDVRSGLLNDIALDSPVLEFAQSDVHFLQKGDYKVSDIKNLKQKGIAMVPLVDKDGKVLHVFNLSTHRSALPLEAVVVAGGRGMRLLPHTTETPKPMLPLAGKPIAEHILKRLASYGIEKIYLSVGYQAQQLIDYFQSGEQLDIELHYVHEEEPLGTFGAISNIEKFDVDVVLVMNADLLTNIDFEDMMLAFEKEEADMMVASIPYEVPIPYAILETEGNQITEFKEKPTYTYYANAGIYLIKKDLLTRIPRHTPYHATDLMRELIDADLKVCYYPILGYWLDIGTPQDYEQAKRDIAHIQF